MIISTSFTSWTALLLLAHKGCLPLWHTRELFLKLFLQSLRYQVRVRFLFFLRTMMSRVLSSNHIYYYLSLLALLLKHLLLPFRDVGPS